MKDETKITLTKSQIEEIVSEAVDKSFERMGVDASNPIELQKDFQHMREFREASDVMKRHGLKTILAIFITGICAALWVGIKQIISS